MPNAKSMPMNRVSQGKSIVRITNASNNAAAHTGTKNHSFANMPAPGVELVEMARSCPLWVSADVLCAAQGSKCPINSNAVPMSMSGVENLELRLNIK
jgi:hypothetical protein